MATCDPGTLLAQAACFNCGLTERDVQLVELALLSKIEGSGASAQTLLTRAACFNCGLTERDVQLVETELLCKWSGGP